MCFLMGAAAGGLLPVAYALLAETMPSRHRGWAWCWSAASARSAAIWPPAARRRWLQPMFGWRIMWFLNLPTGLLLISLSALHPRIAPSSCMQIGRVAEAPRHAGAVRLGGARRRRPRGIDASPAATPPIDAALTGRPSALSSRRWPGAWSISACCCGCRPNWSPRAAASALSSRLLAESALIALPTVFVAPSSTAAGAPSGRWRLMIAVTAVGLAGVLLLDLTARTSPGPAGRAADRRHQRHAGHAAALHGRKLPARGPRPGDRLGRGLQQGRRADRPGAGHAGAGAAAGGRGRLSSCRWAGPGPGRRFGARRAAGTCATWKGRPA